jgi:D-glutamate N-acetyltransferase
VPSGRLSRKSPHGDDRLRYRVPVVTEPSARPPAGTRRLVILAEGAFAVHSAKTAMGVLRYSPDTVTAVIDSSQAGRDVREWLGDAPRFHVPVVASLADALARGPADALLIGIAPTGGRLPAAWRETILEAIGARLDVLSGLHVFLGDDPEFAAAAARAGTSIVDYRRPPDRTGTAVGRRHGPGKRVILTVATDCAIGKMSVALELRRAAVEAGRSAVFVPTGQTGMMIEGWGVAVDRVVSDFLQGAVEDLVADAETRGDWILVEGQGSLDHPAYSSVTLGLIHGATPHAMILVHKPGLANHDFDHLPDRAFPIAEPRSFIEIHERVAGLIAPSKVVAIALNTSLIASDAEARAEIERTAAETGLPCDDPIRFGPDRLWAAVEAGVDALPWVAVGS